MAKDMVAEVKTVDETKPPSALVVFFREIIRDKLALVSFLFLFLLACFVYGVSLFMSTDEVITVDLFSIYEPPGDEFFLGTDKGGRGIFGLLIIGTRNSLSIGLLVTAMTTFIGIVFGLVAGYFGGHVDNVMMRILDMFMILPSLMFFIVFAAIVPKYSVWSFSLIMTSFLWMGTARLVRSITLSEKELEYVQASRTVGSSHFKTMFSHVLPNISSLIVVNLTLALAANIGLETGLTFLGFGFPESTPSLGTLISYATDPVTLESRWWVWLPAAILILLMMLSVRNVGEALNRASDARKRRG